MTIYHSIFVMNQSRLKLNTNDSSSVLIYFMFYIKHGARTFNILICCRLYGTRFKSCGANQFSLHHTHPDQSWGPPNLLYNGYSGSFLAAKLPGHGVEHPPHLAPRLRMSRAIHLLHLCLHSMQQSEHSLRYI